MISVHTSINFKVKDNKTFPSGYQSLGKEESTSIAMSVQSCQEMKVLINCGPLFMINLSKLMYTFHSGIHLIYIVLPTKVQVVITWLI